MSPTMETNTVGDVLPLQYLKMMAIVSEHSVFNAGSAGGVTLDGFDFSGIIGRRGIIKYTGKLDICTFIPLFPQEVKDLIWKHAAAETGRETLEENVEFFCPGRYGQPGTQQWGYHVTANRDPLMAVSKQTFSDLVASGAYKSVPVGFGEEKISEVLVNARDVVKNGPYQQILDNWLTSYMAPRRPLFSPLVLGNITNVVIPLFWGMRHMPELLVSLGELTSLTKLTFQQGIRYPRQHRLYMTWYAHGHDEQGRPNMVPETVDSSYGAILSGNPAVSNWLSSAHGHQGVVIQCLHFINDLSKLSSSAPDEMIVRLLFFPPNPNPVKRSTFSRFGL